MPSSRTLVSTICWPAITFPLLETLVFVSAPTPSAFSVLQVEPRWRHIRRSRYARGVRGAAHTLFRSGIPVWGNLVIPLSDMSLPFCIKLNVAVLRMPYSRELTTTSYYPAGGDRVRCIKYMTARVLSIVVDGQQTDRDKHLTPDDGVQQTPQRLALL